LATEKRGRNLERELRVKNQADMKTRKAKGRRLQNWARIQILESFPDLEPGDVLSKTMSANGEDVVLSPTAQKLFPYSVECKSLKEMALYAWFDQCSRNSEGRHPLLVLKKDGRKPLVAMDAEHFFKTYVKGSRR